MLTNDFLHMGERVLHYTVKNPGGHGHRQRGRIIGPRRKADQFVLNLHASQRPEAPQGSAKPVWVTGRPISSERTVPPWEAATSTPSM